MSQELFMHQQLLNCLAVYIPDTFIIEMHFVLKQAVQLRDCGLELDHELIEGLQTLSQQFN